MGGRSREPVVGGVNPERIAKVSKLASTLAIESGAVVGNVTVCAHAQWQLLPSPRRQAFASSADTLAATVSTGMLAAEMVVVETNRFSGASATHTVPATNLIISTATANTHRPRWRRRRVSSDDRAYGIRPCYPAP